MERDTLVAQIDASLQDTNTLIEIMRAATQPAGRSPLNAAFAVLASRHGMGGWSLLETLTTAATNKETRRRSWMYLLPAIAHIDVTPSEACAITSHLRHADPSCASTLSHAMSGAFQRNLDLGAACLQYAIANPQLSDVNDVSFLASTFAGVNADAALALLPELAQLRNEAADIAVLSAAIVLADNQKTDLLQSHVALLGDVCNRARALTSTAQAAWDCTCRLAEFDEPAMQVIDDAAGAGPDIAQQSICYWLLRTLPERWPNDALLRIAQKLIAAAVSRPEIRPVVDMVMDVMATKPAARQDFIHACDLLCEKHSQVSLEKDFPSVFGQLMTEPALFSALVSRWMLRAGISLSPLQSLIRSCFLHPTLLIPDVRAFTQAHTDDRRRAVQRLLAFAIEGESICGFMFVLAECEALQPWGLHAFRDVLQNYVVDEFPGAASRFLAEKETHLAKDTELGQAIAQIQKGLTDWQQVLQQLPVAKELQLSDSERLTLNVMRLREQRAIHRGASEGSVFASLMTKVHVKQGRKWVVRAPNLPPQLSQMELHSHGFDLPSSERVDPVLGLMRRNLYLTRAQ